VTPGSIVLVDWRDARPDTGEPNKHRPGIVVGATPFFGSGLPFELIVPLTGEPALAIAGASLEIAPTAENGCTKTSYALSWNVQSVPHARITATGSRVSSGEVGALRSQIAACVGIVGA
jgi:mRNA interferase MazF